MVVTIVSALAKVKGDRILERTNEGRLDTKANGVRFGRRSQIDSDRVIKLSREYSEAHVSNWDLPE